jgi:hypothetical protein
MIKPLRETSHEMGRVVTPLARWENFYVIIGSSAGGLTGLQFVVMALIADLPYVEGASQTADAFSTPTIVHFGAALLLAGILSAPWQAMTAPALLCGLCGVIGVVYSLIVAWRLRKQTAYRPVFEDWLFHVLLPVVAYGMLAATGFPARTYASALFGVAAAALLLLFIGIHNAWDSVTYLVLVRRQEQEKAKRP